MSQSFEAWFHALGPVTRNVLVASVALTTATSVGILPVERVLLSWSSLWQLWRPFTAALYFGGFSFPWLMSLGMFVTYLKYNEGGDFKNNTAGLVWMLAFLVSVLSIAGLWLGLPVLSFSLTMSLCWVFCKRNPAMSLSLFGFTFTSGIFPWILLGLNTIMGQGLMPDICGIAAGHLYVFLVEVIPRTHGVQLMTTPGWLQRYFAGRPGRWGEVHPQDQRFAARAAPVATAPAHSWGKGRSLGAN